MANKICYILLFLVTSVHGGYLPFVPTLQPYQVSSPNGKYLFEVKPSHRYGAGPCFAVLTKRDTKEVMWKRELPFTFWQACVNDDGVVGGFGYSKGPMGGEPWGGDDDAGELIVRIFNAAGVAVYEETSRRGPLFMGYTGYSPPLSPKQLLLNAESNCMILRIAGTFRRYDLSEGCLKSAVVPVIEDMPEIAFHCEEARVIPRSPLLLLQLEHFEWKPMVEGTVFGLMDERGKLIWSVNRENKVRQEGDVVYRGSVNYQIVSITAAISPDPFTAPDPVPGVVTPPSPSPVAQFEIFYGDTGERVTYHLLETKTEREVAWSVRETNRIKWVPLEVNRDNTPMNIPRLESTKLGEFQLLGSDQNPLSGIVSVALGPDEQIYTLDSTTGSVHVFDRSGKPLHVCRPPKGQRLETNWSRASLTVDDQGEVFVKLARPHSAEGEGAAKTNPEGGHFLHFSRTGAPESKLLPPSQRESEETWLAQPKTTRLMITDYRPEARLVNRDEYGSLVAVLTRRADGHWFEAIEDICFAPDGSIAVRSGAIPSEALYGFPQPFPLPPSHLPTETITFYEPDGIPIRTIDFTAGAKLSEIAFDGTYLIGTGSCDPPDPAVYVFKATGEILGAIPIDSLAGKKKIDLKPFLVGRGNTILVLDCESARVFRYSIPAK